MKSEFTLAFNEVAEHTKLKREVVLAALENALVNAYRKAVNASTAQHVVAKIDLQTGGITVYAEKEVVEAVVDERTEVSLEDARRVDPDIRLGDMLTVESTPKEFGRIAAQTAKQVILQRIREAERESQYQEYSEREGDIVNGTVQSINNALVTIGLGRTEAKLPRKEQVPGEKYRPHDKIRAYVLEVRRTNRGPEIIVSRAHKNMLRRLLEYEVPEIYNGAVEIKSIAREAGRRSKVAVAAMQEGVDPVGACVGMRGVRIQSLVRELSNEKIDVIEWNPDSATFIAKALSPARVSGVYLDDDPVNGRTALVVVPDDQLSLAIGREGQNARLAAKLTQWRIDIKGLTEAAGGAVKHMAADGLDLAAKLGDLPAQVENALAKKAESKPLTPEEYQALFRFVDTVEKARAAARLGEREVKLRRVAEVRKSLPPAAYEKPLSESGLPEKLLETLSEAGFENAGAVMEQLALDEDRLLALDGVGPKTMEELKAALAALTFEPVPPEPEPEPEPAPAPEPEPAPVEPAPVMEAAAAVEAPAAEAVAAAEVAEPEPPVTLEEYLEIEDEDEEEGEVGKKKKAKGKGKRKAREIEFDEELGVYITKRKHKRGDDGV